jgi:2-polyprenyl-3-methyl-5-hydroxy-6-metoxy-1,4-benzoquinol methylase
MRTPEQLKDQGISLDNEGYLALFDYALDEVSKWIHTATLFDAGTGIGAMLKVAGRRGIEAKGWDTDKAYCEHYKAKTGLENYKVFNIAKAPKLPKADVYSFIEVAQEMEEKELQTFLLRANCKYMIFSATSGRSKAEWVEYLREGGFGFVQDLPRLTAWAILVEKMAQ